MSNRRYIFAVVFAVIAFVVYSTLTSSKPAETIQIGIMSSGERHVPEDLFQGEYANAEINSYCEENDIPYRFEFVYTNASNNADNAKALTKWYNENGVDIVIGYNWGSHMDASDYEAKHRGITIISPYSTTSLHRTIYPHIIQLTPVETHQAEVVAMALIDRGFDKVVTITETESLWGYLFFQEFNASYTGFGGEIIDYQETPSTANTPFFDLSMGRVEKAVVNASRTYGNDTLAVLTTWNYFHPDSLTLISKYPGLMNVTWYGTDHVHLSPMDSFSVPNDLSRLNVLHPVMDRSPYTKNPVYRALNIAYRAEFDGNLSRYDGALYDACWIAALSVIQTGSTLNTTLIEAIPGIALEYTGATGECGLDEHGDRAKADYYLYEYIAVDHGFEAVLVGYYRGSQGRIQWFD